MLKLYLLGIVGGAAVRMKSRDFVISILEEHAESLQLAGRHKWSKDSNDWVLLEGIMKVACDNDIAFFSMEIVMPFFRDIVRSGQNPNVAIPVHFAHSAKVSTTPLCNAVYFKQQWVVRELLLANADPNLCEYHYSPLRMCTFYCVIGWESLHMLGDLLDAGASISQGDLADAKTSVELARRPRIGHYELLEYSFNVLQACRKNDILQLRPPEESHQYFDIHPSVFSTDKKGQCALSYAFHHKNTRNIVFCLRYGLKFVKRSRFELNTSPLALADRVPASGFRVRMFLKLLFPVDRIRACAMLIKSCKSFLSQCILFRNLPQDLVIKCILTPDVVLNLNTVDHILRHNEDIAMMVASKHTLGKEIRKLGQASENLDSFLPSLKAAINRYMC